MRATVVATPVLAHLSRAPSTWRVIGATSSALYLVRDEFVIALTIPSTPLMPNGVRLERAPVRWPEAGSTVGCSVSSMRFEGWAIELELGSAVVWEPRVASGFAASPAGGAWSDARLLLARGPALLQACNVPCPAVPDPDSLSHRFGVCDFGLASSLAGRRAIRELLIALYERDADRAVHAADLLLGRGAGLTPEGDDLLCGAAAVVSIAGQAASLSGAERRAWLAALCPKDASARSSWLSVTLLRLACEGCAAEPVIAVLDPRDEADWRSAVFELLGVGSSTGLAYALGIGSAAALLAASAPSSVRQEGDRAAERGLPALKAPRKAAEADPLI